MTENENIIKSNLSDLSRLESSVAIIRRSQIEEAALCLKDADPEEAANFFKNAFGESPVSGDMLTLCSLICPKIGYKEERTGSTIKVSCIKNPLSAPAIRKMCEAAKTLVILEEADFRSVCEACTSGNADFCLLPMCSSTDGYYPTFLKLSKTYDLKICKTINVSKSDSDEELRFALLSRNLEIQRDAKYCTFTFSEEEQGTLPALLNTLYSADCIPVSVISSPIAYNMDKHEHRLVVQLGALSPEVLLYFLEASLPGHTVLGIYRSYK